MGAPAVTLPKMEGENGMPIGVQIIGARGADAKLLADAARILSMSSTGMTAGDDAPVDAAGN